MSSEHCISQVESLVTKNPGWTEVEADDFISQRTPCTMIQSASGGDSVAKATLVLLEGIAVSLGIPITALIDEAPATIDYGDASFFRRHLDLP